MKERLIELVKKTASSLDKNDRLTIAIYFMGLVGEIGETIQAYDISKEELKTELADIVWYTVAISIMLNTECLLDDIDFCSNTLPSGKQDLNKPLYISLQCLEKAKKYVRDYPSRPIESLNGYIEPLSTISRVFDLSDSFDILNEKLGKRYPNGFVINPVRD